MSRVIAIVNQKGGVGKTTTAVNLAASLAFAERKTLLIDLDPQGNATTALGIDRTQIKDKKSIYHALIGQATLREILLPTEVDGLLVAPADTHLAGAEIELVTAFSRESKLRQALEEVRGEFDYTLIDCPPSIGLLSVNALTAADGYLVPLQTQYFALEGLSQLLRTADLIRQNLNPKLEEEGIVLTMQSYDRLSHEIEKDARSNLGDRVLQTVIPKNVKLSESPSHGKPILLYDPSSKGCVAYFDLAKEILSRHQAKPVPPPFSHGKTESSGISSGV